MKEILIEYGVFLGKGLTVLVLTLIALGSIIKLRKENNSEKNSLKITKINDTYRKLKNKILSNIISKKEKKSEIKKLKQLRKEKKSEIKKLKKEIFNKVFVCKFVGDINAKETDQLREKITAILSVAKENDEVILCLESPGGVVHGYGLAASQLDRIKKQNIKLTITVDKVAASGGYMMACVADKIIAAPFAIIGSIGVVAQIPNFYRLLDKKNIDIELHTAGEYKRTLTMLGKNTSKGRKKFVDDLEEIHSIFKSFVKEHRPALNVNKVSTGEIWLGQQAIKQGLVDEIMTSDEYILQKIESNDVFLVEIISKKSIKEKLAQTSETLLEKIANKVWRQISNRYFS